MCIQERVCELLNDLDDVKAHLLEEDGIDSCTFNALQLFDFDGKHVKAMDEEVASTDKVPLFDD